MTLSLAMAADKFALRQSFEESTYQRNIPVRTWLSFLERAN
jgi:hypothetical protein